MRRRNSAILLRNSPTVFLTDPSSLCRAAPKPFGVLDADGTLWSAASVGTCKDRVDFAPDAETCYDLVALAVEQGGSKQAVGKRPLLTRSYESVGGKEVEKLTFSDTYEWTSYADWGANFAALGASMVNWGGAKAGDSVVIYAETQMEWMLACQAAYSQSLTVVTIYATLGEEGVLHGCAQTKAPLMVLDAKLMGKVAGAIKKDRSQMKHLKKVIFIPDPCRSADPKAAAVIDAGLKALEKAGVQIEEIGKLITDGMKSLVPAAPPKPDDLAVIMYTSGTTGLPKGVKISHRSMVAVIGGMVEKMVGYGVNPASKAQETYLAYLPLAHIMEMVVEMQLLSIGARLAYGSPHTLTPTGVKLKTGTCQGDAFCASPTIMVFAPAVLDKVFAGLNAKIAAGSPAVQKLFKWGLAAGEKNWDQGIVGSHWLYQKIVFKKVQAMLGGKVKLAFTGSAPLAPHVQKFVQTAFNCPVRQGYGLTETCAATCVGEACDNTTSVIGPPTSSNCVKLEDWAEGNYFFADKDKPGVGMPRGEILIGGPCVCNGYFVDKANPDADVVKKNKEDFFVDPKSGYTFFHTGDIGQITPDGCVQIIDRKKDLVKLQQGEYVALSKVENVLKNSLLVEVPMCYGRSDKDYCIALVCPLAKPLADLAATLGVSGDHKALCENAAVVAAVTKSIVDTCKAKLVGFEVPKKIGLVAELWTPDNDLLTATMKLKRQPIIKKHQALIDKLYA